MNKTKTFLENTKDALPHINVIKFIEMNKSMTGNAIDLGCGAGRDTIYLIKNGWKVLSIDKEDTQELIYSKLNNTEIENFTFKCQDFRDLKLENTNLLVANFSIPFCEKNYFTDFWNKIVNSIQKDRIFCW